MPRPTDRDRPHLEDPNVLVGVAAVDGREALVPRVDDRPDGEDLEIAAPNPGDLREGKEKCVNPKERSREGTLSRSPSFFRAAR